MFLCLIYVDFIVMPSSHLCPPLPHVQDLSKSPKSVKKLLPKRKPERKQSEEEFALRKSKFEFLILKEQFDIWERAYSLS